MKVEPDDLRAFSDALWAIPEVEAACLELQDGFGADVNLILFALYLGMHGRAADEATRTRATAIANDWTQAVIASLRAARRALKARDADLHARAKALELDAERALQARLQSVADAAPDMAGDGAINASLAAFIGERAAEAEAARRLLAAVPRRAARL
jgi:uncharacterized protein (TIGR02444 family)